MSVIEAIQFINEQKKLGYFPIKIESYNFDPTSYYAKLRVRVVPVPQNSNFDFRYSLNVTEEDYEEARAVNKDYALIWEQAPYMDIGYNAIWVNNEVVRHDFDNATVFEVPYSINSYNSAENLPEHLIKAGISTVIEKTAAYLLGVSFSWVSYFHLGFTVLVDFLEYGDPLIVMPLTPELDRDGSEFVGRGACEGRDISGIILLDLVRPGTADIDPAKLNDLKFSSQYWKKDNYNSAVSVVKDEMVVLERDEIGTLSKERSYYIIPKRPLSAPAKIDPGFIKTYNYFRLFASTMEDGNIFGYGSGPNVFFGNCSPKSPTWLHLLLLTEESNSLNVGLIVHWKFDGNANDESGNNNHGVEHGGVTYEQGIIGQAASFDGIDDYIHVWNTSEINAQVDTNKGSISVWFKATDHRQTYVHCYSDGRNDDRLYLSLNPTNYFLLSGLGEGNVWSTSSYNLNEWVHVVKVWENNAHKLYVNGVYENSTAFNGGFNFSSPGEFVFGRRGYPTDRYYKGLIDEVRIYNRALSQSEIEALSGPLNYDTIFCGAWSETDGDQGTFCMSLNISETTFNGKYDATKSTNEGGSDTYPISGTRAGNDYEGTDSRGRQFTLELSNNYSFISGSYFDPDGGETGTLISP